jgi:hypothetical protein
MKKSNKILLSGFLTLVLLITAIHLTIYARYKGGQYTEYTAEEDAALLSLQAFPNVLFVMVQDVPIANVTFSDVARVDKDDASRLQFSQKGDTLQIRGNTEDRDRPFRANLYLPYNATLSVQNSTLSFAPGKAGTLPNPQLFLKHATAVFPSEPGAFRLGRLKVEATDGSVVRFLDKTTTEQLDLRLAGSLFESTGAHFGSLSILTDSLSHLSIPSSQLLKATIRTTTE